MKFRDSFEAELWRDIFVAAIEAKHPYRECTVIADFALTAYRDRLLTDPIYWDERGEPKS